MLRLTALATLIALSLIAIGCRHERPVVGPPGQVGHVVICWLKTPGDSAQRRELIEVSKRFADLPGVVHVAAGEVLPSKRPVVVSDYDVAVVLTFEDEASLRAYEAHPRHQAALRETLRPLTTKVVVYDYVQR